MVLQLQGQRLQTTYLYRDPLGKVEDEVDVGIVVVVGSPGNQDEVVSKTNELSIGLQQERSKLWDNIIRTACIRTPP